jgi:hypothetical protein
MTPQAPVETNLVLPRGSFATSRRSEDLACRPRRQPVNEDSVPSLEFVEKLRCGPRASGFHIFQRLGKRFVQFAALFIAQVVALIVNDKIKLRAIGQVGRLVQHDVAVFNARSQGAHAATIRLPRIPCKQAWLSICTRLDLKRRAWFCPLRRGAEILHRPRDLLRCGGCHVKRPVRIAQEFAGEQDDVGLA